MAEKTRSTLLSDIDDDITSNDTGGITGPILNALLKDIVDSAKLDEDVDTLLLPSANGAATSLFGRSANSSGARADIAASADGQVLRRSGGALGFGAVDLADTDAVTGTLPAGNLPAATTSAIGAVEEATDAEVYAAVDGKFLDAAHLETAGAYVPITDGGSPSFDWDAGINRSWTVAANRAVPNPTNGQPGTYRCIWFKGNDGTDRTITWGTQFEGTLPTITNLDNVTWYECVIKCLTATHFAVVGFYPVTVS